MPFESGGNTEKNRSADCEHRSWIRFRNRRSRELNTARREGELNRVVQRNCQNSGPYAERPTRKTDHQILPQRLGSQTQIHTAAGILKAELDDTGAENIRGKGWI